MLPPSLLVCITLSPYSFITMHTNRNVSPPLWVLFYFRVEKSDTAPTRLSPYGLIDVIHSCILSTFCDREIEFASFYFNSAPFHPAERERERENKLAFKSWILTPSPVGMGLQVPTPFSPLRFSNNRKSPCRWDMASSKTKKGTKIWMTNSPALIDIFTGQYVNNVVGNGHLSWDF